MTDITDKYYTPAIEEFHVGVEFEYYNAEEWVKCVFSEMDLTAGSKKYGSYLVSALGCGFIRVKHLSQDDIIECGWSYVEHITQGDGDFRWFDKFIFNGKKFTLKAFYHNKDLDNLSDKVIIEILGVVYFNGFIRNKSELKQVMKMIGI